jgi:hypothetical protein
LLHILRSRALSEQQFDRELSRARTTNGVKRVLPGSPPAKIQRLVGRATRRHGSKTGESDSALGVKNIAWTAKHGVIESIKVFDAEIELYPLRETDSPSHRKVGLVD